MLSLLLQILLEASGQGGLLPRAYGSPWQDAPVPADKDEEIAQTRRQILELEKDIATKQAKWDKLYAEYQRIMNLTGGRLNATAQSKIAKLDADARKIKADIDAQKAVLEATQQHLLQLEEERDREQELRDAERERQSRPRPSEGDDGSTGGGGSTDEQVSPKVAHELPPVLLIDLSDPIGAGGRCTAQYFVEKLGADGVEVEEGESFRVEFDGSGFPSKVPGYRAYQRADIGGVEIIDGDFQQMARMVVARKSSSEDGALLEVDRIIGQSGRESGSRWRFALGSLGLRLEAIEFESSRLMFEFDLVGASLPPLWQQIGSADGADRILFAYYPSGRIASVRWNEKSVEYSYGSEGRLEETALVEDGRTVMRIDFDGWDQSERWISAQCVVVSSLGKERVTTQLRRVFGGGPISSRFPRREFNLLDGPAELTVLPPPESPAIMAAQAEAARQKTIASQSASRGGTDNPDDSARSRPADPAQAPRDEMPGQSSQVAADDRSSTEHGGSDNTTTWVVVICLCVLVSAIVGWRVTPAWTYDWIARSMMSTRRFVQQTGLGKAKNGGPGITDEEAEGRARLLEFGARLIIAILFGTVMILLWLFRWFWRNLGRSDGKMTS